MIHLINYLQFVKANLRDHFNIYENGDVDKSYTPKPTSKAYAV
jgi:hypothetical protein